MYRSSVLVFILLCSLVSPSFAVFGLYNATRRLTNSLLNSTWLTPEDMSTPAILQRHGYPVETHQVHTEDGYILEVYRIPHGANSSSGGGGSGDKYPVIVQHGNFQSSGDWLIAGSESLGFFLADNGYDVWLGNQRGNEYSQKHLEHPNHGSAFWNFSFHELGIYDLPAVLNHVTNVTGKKKAHYISYSLGSTAFFAGMSKREELSEKVALGLVMGPSTFQRNFWHGWLQLFAPFVWFVQVMQKYAGEGPVLPFFLARALHLVLPVICHPKLDVFGICVSAVQIGFGNDRGKISKQRLHAITKISPTSSSMKAFVHEMQLMGTGRYCEYDYGSERNMIAYGMEEPPDYNLTNVRAPIALVVGRNDFLAHKEDAKLLASKLPNVVDFHFVPYDEFTHLDFCYADDVHSLVYDYVIRMLNKYDNT